MNENQSQNELIDLQAQLSSDMNELSQAASALFRIPVFFSHQNLFTLNPQRQAFVIRMFKEIKRVLLFPRTLPNTDQYPGTTLENIRRIVISSYGMAAVLLSPNTPTMQGEPYSPLLQIEPAMGYQYGLPLLLVKESTIKAGGVWGDAGPLAPFTPITWFSDTTTVDQFFNSVEWKEVLQNWAGQVRSGYFIQTQPEFKYTCNNNK